MLYKLQRYGKNVKSPKTALSFFSSYINFHSYLKIKGVREVGVFHPSLPDSLVYPTAFTTPRPSCPLGSIGLS
jgi:hypothetical protein